MVIKELAVERYAFMCPHCVMHWIRDYDVQHVIDGNERTWAYYSFNGLPACAPNAPGAVVCPSCGAEHLYVSLEAIRTTPVPHPAHDRPRHPVTEEHQARREEAPLLPGEPGARKRPGRLPPWLAPWSEEESAHVSPTVTKTGGLPRYQPHPAKSDRPAGT